MKVEFLGSVELRMSSMYGRYMSVDRYEFCLCLNVVPANLRGVPRLTMLVFAGIVNLPNSFSANIYRQKTPNPNLHGDTGWRWSKIGTTSHPKGLLYNGLFHLLDQHKEKMAGVKQVTIQFVEG